MKKAILLLILIGCLTTTFGQKFSLDELIKLNTMNLDNFDTYVTTKGYKYFENFNDEFAEGNSYSFDQNQSNDHAANFISKYTYKLIDNKMVSFQTLKTVDYLSIKNKLKVFGFVYIGTETNDKGAIFLNYKKGKMEAALMSNQKKNDYGDNVTYYEISISTPKK